MGGAMDRLQIVGGYAAKRSDFVRRKINPNPVRRNAHSLAREIVSMVGINSSKPTIGRVRDRITALDVRRVTPETFRLEFSHLMSALGTKPTEEQLDQMFRLVYRPQIATNINSTSGLTSAICLHLGLSPQKRNREEEQENRDQEKINQIRHFLVHAKCVESHSFRNDLRDLLRSLEFSPTGEDLRLICSMVVEFRRRIGINRQAYHVGLDSSARMQQETPAITTPDGDDPDALEWIEPFMRLQRLQLDGVINDEVSLQQLHAIWSGKAPGLHLPTEDEELLELADMAMITQKRCPSGAHLTS